MKHAFHIVLMLAFTFFLTQFIGLTVVSKYIDVEATRATGELKWQELPEVAGIRFERPEIKETRAPWYLFAAIIVGTLLLLFLIKLKSLLLVKAWFFLAMGVTLFVSFGAFLPGWLAALIGFGLALLRLLRPSLLVHNITEVFIYGGLAAIFVPVLNVIAAALLLLLLSLYDMYAVWKSKHMIKLATFQAKSRVFVGLVFPSRLKEISKVPKKLKTKGKIPVAVLGGGDMGFPLLFAGAVMKKLGFAPSLLVPAFATMALILLLVLGKKGRFYPAMPFLSLGCATGYGVALLLRMAF